MKKALRKTISILLAVVMIASTAPLGGFVGLDLPDISSIFVPKAEAASNSGACGENAYWNFDETTGELVISGEGDMWDYTNNGDYIYTSPLSNNPDIKKIVIGDNITKIGDMFFVDCDNVVTLIIGDSVKTVGYMSFAMCDKLTNITFGKSVENIDSGAFYLCTSLIDFSLPKKLKRVGDSTFLGCSSLNEIIIPDGVTEIGYGAFNSCTNIKNISLPDTLTRIGDDAFYGTEFYETVENWDDGTLYIGSYLIEFDSANNAYEIKAGTTVIAERAFEYCSLQNVTIPESVKYIGEDAFCSSKLQEVYIPKDVTQIGAEAFGECEYLKKISVSDENEYYSADSYGVLFNKNKTELILFPIGSQVTSYTIPESVTDIDNYAFDSSKLSDIVIGSNVVNIGKYAFSWCDNITDIYIPSKVKTIGDGAFSSCEKLQSIVIPNNVTYLGQNAFWYCESLVSAEIGSGINIIDNQLFERCSSLANITIPDTITEIGDHAFDGCSSLKIIKLPSNLKSIGYSAFEYTGLEQIIIPETVETIEGHAFTACDSLTDIVIKSKYIDLETYSITECAYTENVNNWTNGALYIGSILLDINELSETFEIKEGTTCLAKSLFNCDTSENLLTVYIPNSINIISQQAFSPCSNLSDVYYDGTQEEWNNVEIGALNTPLLKATIHFNDGTIYKHEHKFDNYTGSYECLDIYVCTCGESTYICRHIDENNDQVCDFCKVAIDVHICEYTSKITQAPTCTEEGVRTYTCECDNSYTEAIPALGHTSCDWETVTEPTTTTEGEMVRKCGVCGEVTERKAIPTVTEYTITFLINGVSVYAVSYQEGKTIDFNNIPDDSCVTVEGYTFNGWFDESGNAFGSYTTMPDENLEYQAVFTANTYTLTINANGGDFFDGSEIKTFEVVYGTVIEFPEDPTREGYCFLGYNPAGIPATMPANDMTFTAVWEEIEIEHTHTPKTITIPASCNDAGAEYQVCDECGEPIGQATVIPATGHTAGKWETILEPTITSAGKKVVKCTVCGELLEEELIPMLRTVTVTDDESGISLTYPEDDYSGDVDVVVKKSFDGAAFNLVDTKTSAVQTFIYDITMMIDGVETQPSGKITVRIPLPEGYNSAKTNVYHVDTSTGKVEKMPAEYVAGYMVFETDHFSYYALVEEYDGALDIRTPSTSSISYGDSIILHADVSEALPKGWSIKWSASNGNFDMETSANGTTCTITPEKSGDTVFTATIYDADGNIVSADEQTMTSKAGFFDKIIAFFKKLFGLTKTYPDIFKKK